MNHWTYLALAIVSEVIATSALKLSDGFSRFWPSVIVVFGYAISFYCLSLILKTLPVGVVYAIWSGAGIALIAVIGWIFLGQTLDWPAILGLSLIIAGVIVINLFSRSLPH